MSFEHHKTGEEHNVGGGSTTISAVVRRVPFQEWFSCLAC